MGLKRLSESAIHTVCMRAWTREALGFDRNYIYNHIETYMYEQHVVLYVLPVSGWGLNKRSVRNHIYVCFAVPKPFLSHR